MLREICKELGVEIGEEWEDHQTGEKYKISPIGLEKFREYDETWNLATAYDHGKLMRGNLKPNWKPKYGEEYQTPQLDSQLKFSSHLWQDHECDYLLMRRGLVFKTAEEAIDCAINMIELAKHGI